MDHDHHGTRHGNHQPHLDSGNQDQHRILDLDVEVFGDHLAAVLDTAGVSGARSIVDLGAGTGAGSRMLRDRYPDAEMMCIDNDPQMLETLRKQGFTVIEADLNNGFPALADSSTTADPILTTPPDLVWASSSLHHVQHPGRLLSGVRGALVPSGVLVVAELADLPRFLSHAPEAQLEQRCHAAAAAEGWNRYQNWTPAIEAAGFAVTQSEVTTIAPVTPAAREYAQQWFARFSHLETLSANDRAYVKELLERFPKNTELEPRTTRTVWLATPTRASTGT